ncbi:MAG TPA: hypothetical protein VIV55_08710, partial [Flavobacterium sp.]
MLTKSIKLSLISAIVSLATTTVVAQNPVVKIDFDHFTTTQVSDPDYTPWAVGSVNTDSKVVNGVTFTVTRVGTKGDILGTNWYKNG